MKDKGWNNVIVILSAMVIFYWIFDMVFFVFLGNVTVDVIIGLIFIFLIFMIYKKSRKFFYSYLWGLTKNIYISFFTLLNLLISFRKLIINYNSVYLDYYIYNFIALDFVSTEMSNIFYNLNINLSNNYLRNNYLNQLIFKLNFINKQINYLPVEYTISNEIIFELNIMFSYELIIFLNK